ncbi:MAG: hypothetical protein HYY67_05440 [Thaumarchaeota archaeon]|nr:hypothetical protein [Nitrososphaerota archaeon]
MGVLAYLSELLIVEHNASIGSGDLPEMTIMDIYSVNGGDWLKEVTNSDDLAIQRLSRR